MADWAEDGKKRLSVLHSCHIYAQGLSQSHAGFLVVNSVCVSTYQLRLTDSMSFLVVWLSPQAHIIFLSPLLLDF